MSDEGAWVLKDTLLACWGWGRGQGYNAGVPAALPQGWRREQGGMGCSRATSCGSWLTKRVRPCVMPPSPHRSCPATVVMGRRWADPEDVLTVRFYGHCHHLVTAYTRPSRGPSACTGYLLSVARLLCPGGRYGSTAWAVCGLWGHAATKSVAVASEDGVSCPSRLKHGRIP